MLVAAVVPAVLVSTPPQTQRLPLRHSWREGREIRLPRRSVWRCWRGGRSRGGRGRLRVVHWRFLGVPGGEEVWELLEVWEPVSVLF